VLDEKQGQRGESEERVVRIMKLVY
jgi:hypothetical protein